MNNSFYSFIIVRTVKEICDLLSQNEPKVATAAIQN